MIVVNKQASTDFNKKSSNRVLREIQKQADMGVTCFHVSDIQCINNITEVTRPLEAEGLEVCERGQTFNYRKGGIAYFDIKFRMIPN